MIRSRQKQHRQDAILDAAEALVRELGANNFSMISLSEKAGISPATPYNLFGTKASILYALLNRSLDKILEGTLLFEKEPDPFRKVLIAADAAGRFFAGDPDYYRPLYQYLLGVTDPVHRPAYMERALGYWRFALSDLCAKKIIEPEIMESMARTIVIHVVGALDLFIHHDLDGSGFRAHVVHGTILLLFHIATGKSRTMLESELQKVGKEISAIPMFSGTEQPNINSKKSA
jgi:AcrR family transcriptional regulator